MVGGLVFQPLSNEYLQGWAANDRPSHLQDLFLSGHVTPERDEVVILTQVLADTINTGYDSGWVGAPLVDQVNGVAVRNLHHLVELVDTCRKHSSSDFLAITVRLGGGPFCIALPLHGLDEADRRICLTYGLPPRSAGDARDLSGRF